MKHERVEVRTVGDLKTVRDLTQELVGKVCWGASLGYGEELTLDIGGRVLRLPASVPANEKGEWVLRARATPWWIEPAACAEGDVAALLRSIEGVRITKVAIAYPEMSLTLTFDNLSTLRLLPEEPATDEHDALAHWELFGPERLALSVGPGPVWTLTSQ
jgi:hypothetical protein